MKSKNLTCKEIQELLNSCDGPIEYKKMVYDYLTSKLEALDKEPFAKWVLEILPMSLRIECCENHDVETRKIVTQDMLKNRYMFDKRGIIKNPVEFNKIVWEMMDAKLFNIYGKLDRSNGNKGAFIGVMLIMYDCGMFKNKCGKNKQVTKVMIWEWVCVNFGAGDGQEFNRKLNHHKYKAMARERVKFVEEIEANYEKSQMEKIEAKRK